MRCRFAIDKNGRLTSPYLGLIRTDFFPDSRILHGLRDPRDVAASCLEQKPRMAVLCADMTYI